MKRLYDLLCGLWLWLNGRRLWVELDGRDTSVTFSPFLWRWIRRRWFAGVGVRDAVVPRNRSERRRLAKIKVKGEPRVLVFRDGGEYAFMLSRHFGNETHTADVQHNGYLDCYGFECLVPTVARIFYDYGIKGDVAVVKLSVRLRRSASGQLYWRMKRGG